VNLGALLAATIAQLERAGVPYMITGSVASSYHGEPRATRDLDIVIDPGPAGISRLAGELEAAGLYADADAALRPRTACGVEPDGGASVGRLSEPVRSFKLAAGPPRPEPSHKPTAQLPSTMPRERFCSGGSRRFMLDSD
jgi:hypothetical protein